MFVQMTYKIETGNQLISSTPNQQTNQNS